MSKTQTAKKQRKRKPPAPYKPGASFMTRSQMPGYLAETFGLPVKLSSLDKLAMSGRLRADKYFGNHCLYSPQTADRLASELLSDRPGNARINPDPPQAA
jgi:hypothetical protein